MQSITSVMPRPWIPYAIAATLAAAGSLATLAVADAQDQAAATVRMTNALEYTPPRVTVNAGETVVWRNDSDLVQTVTADPDLASSRKSASVPAGAQPFNSGRLAPGATYRQTFRVPGEYRYFSIPHESAGMIGHVIVR